MRVRTTVVLERQGEPAPGLGLSRRSQLKCLTATNLIPPAVRLGTAARTRRDAGSGRPLTPFITDTVVTQQVGDGWASAGARRRRPSSWWCVGCACMSATPCVADRLAGCDARHHVLDRRCFRLAG